VSFCNIYVTPYAKIYIDAILGSGNQVTLLFWDRDAVKGQNDNYPKCEKIVYQRKLTNTSSKKEKLLGYIEATRFFRKALKDNNFSGVILLQTHAAVACESILRKRYPKRYIIDIRDYTMENLRIYRKLEKKVIDSSFMSVISSPAYEKFLPEHKYVIAHNYTPYSQTVVDEVRKKSKENKMPIKISFIGKVRFIDMDKKLLSLFANDERFKLCYYGTGSEVLEAFCKEKQINNVDFYGRFQPEQTASFYSKTNLINNLYGNHNPYLDFALSNKLYHAAQFHIPILVCPETYMEEISKKYAIGYVFDVNDTSGPNKLYDWFQKLDYDKMSAGADEFLEKVKKDNEEYLKQIERFVG